MRIGSIRNAVIAVAVIAAPRPVRAQTSSSCSPTEPIARVFGPVFTSADSGRIYASTMSPDGRDLYFFKRIGPGDEEYRIFVSHAAGNAWSAPEIVDLGGAYSDLYPAISPDGTRLVFSSYRPAPGDTSSHPNAHLWMSHRTARGWSAPEYVSASRPGHYHSGLRFDASGDLHFRLTTPDWRTQRDVVIHWNGRAFDTALVADAAMPGVEYWRSAAGDSVYIWGGLESPDGTVLLSISTVSQPGNRRAPATFFITKQTTTGWSPLAPAGAGLDRGAPNFAWFSPDGCFLHYTRDYSGFMRVPVAALGRNPAG